MFPIFYLFAVLIIRDDDDEFEITCMGPVAEDYKARGLIKESPDRVSGTAVNRLAD